MVADGPPTQADAALLPLFPVELVVVSLGNGSPSSGPPGRVEPVASQLGSAAPVSGFSFRKRSRDSLMSQPRSTSEMVKVGVI